MTHADEKLEPKGNMMTRHFENVSLAQALGGNAIVSLVTLTGIEQWLKIILLLGSVALTGITIYYKVKHGGK